MGYVSTGMGDRFSALLVSLMALRLALIGRPCFSFFFVTRFFYGMCTSIKEYVLPVCVIPMFLTASKHRGQCPTDGFLACVCRSKGFTALFFFVPKGCFVFTVKLIQNNTYLSFLCVCLVLLLLIFITDKNRISNNT